MSAVMVPKGRAYANAHEKHEKPCPPHRHRPPPARGPDPTHRRVQPALGPPLHRVVLAGSGEGGYIPRSTSGVFGFGSAACSCSDSRPEPCAPPGSRSSSQSGLPESYRLACVRRSAPATSRRAVRRLLAQSVARIGRGRDPSRQRRVPRDRRPSCGPRRGRTRSPGLERPHGRPTLTPDSSRLCGVPRSQDVCRQRLECATPHNSTPQHRPTRRRRGHGPAPARSSAAPRCRSAASPPSANAAAVRRPPAPSSR